MSLVALALRIATVELLKGATFAQDRVRDSMIDPASLLKADTQPFIIVAVDSTETLPTGRDLLGAPRTVSLTLDVALAGKVVIERPPEEGGGEVEQITVPHTDAGMEVVLDLIGRQIERAFLQDNAWAKVWRTFAPSIKKVSNDRGAASENGIRYATRQIIVTANAMAEPSFGDVVGVWVDFLALARAKPSLAQIADLIETEITTPTLEGWAKARSDIGLNSQFSFGEGSVSLLDPPPQPVTGATVQFPGGEWNDDAGSIDDALGPEANP